MSMGVFDLNQLYNEFFTEIDGIIQHERKPVQKIRTEDPKRFGKLAEKSRNLIIAITDSLREGKTLSAGQEMDLIKKLTTVIKIRRENLLFA